MTAQSESDYTWRRSRTKGIFTRRADFGIMIMDYNYNDNAEFVASSSFYFINDDLSDKSDNDDDDNHKAVETDSGENEDGMMTEHNNKLKVMLGSCSSNECGHKLLPHDVQVATATIRSNNMINASSSSSNNNATNNSNSVNSDSDTNSFDAIVNGVFGSKNNVVFVTKADSNTNGDADTDFTDIAIARSVKQNVIEYGQGDTNDAQQQQKEGMKDGHKNVTVTMSVKHREKKKPKFIPSAKFGWFDLLVGMLSIGLFFVDIGTDIELAVHYFRNSLWMYGGVTTGLIMVPSLVTCFLGLHWYIIDCNKEQEKLQRLETKKDKVRVYETPNYVWFLRFFFTLLQCGPVIRVIEYLYWGYKSRCKHVDHHERKRYYLLMLYGDADSCLLRLFESFLEAAPQLTWQLYIVIDLKPEEDDAGTSLRVLAMLSSWGSLALALTSYHKSLRNSHEEKAKMSLKSLPLYFIWRACETGGRMLCIAMFASAFRLWVFGPLIFHWAFMSAWLILQKTTFYKNKCMEKVFNIICGYVMIFCFLNLREGQTRFRFLLFYFIFYAGNFVMLALWFRFTQDLGAWFHLWGFIVVLLLFVFHVTFQLLYYKFQHPTKNIKVCLPCTHYVICSSICYEVQNSE